MSHAWPLREPYTQEFTSSGLATLSSDPVPQGQAWHVKRVSFEGDKATSGGNTRARVHVLSGTVKQPQIEQQSPTANTLYWDDLDVELVEGEKLELEWDQAQANTTLKMYINGIALILYTGPGPTPAREPQEASREASIA